MRALILCVIVAVSTPAWAQDDSYHRAFAALAEGRTAEARALLGEWLVAHPGDPDRAHVEALLARLGADEDERDEVGAVEKNTRFARVEVAVGTTFVGIAAGIELCLIAECFDNELVFLVPALGAGAGLAAGLWVTRHGITPGHASAVTSGSGWGTWAAAATAVIADTDDEKAIGALLLGGQFGGMLAGELLWRGLRPDAGQVAAANSVGMWGGVLTAASFGAFGGDDPDPRAVVGTSLAVSLVGLGAGAYLAAKVPMSRGRVLTIDALGVVGGLLGLGTAVLIAGEDTGSATAFRAVLPGALVGLAFGTWLTRSWDGPKHAPSIGIAPTRGGATLLVGGTF